MSGSLALSWRFWQFVICQTLLSRQRRSSSCGTQSQRQQQQAQQRLQPLSRTGRQRWGSQEMGAACRALARGDTKAARLARAEAVVEQRQLRRISFQERRPAHVRRRRRSAGEERSAALPK